LYRPVEGDLEDFGRYDGPFPAPRRPRRAGVEARGRGKKMQFGAGLRQCVQRAGTPV
jgi:hypothetical protein